MMETVSTSGSTTSRCTASPSRAATTRFAFDSYRRLMQMFGATVMGIDGAALLRRARQR